MQLTPRYRAAAIASAAECSGDKTGPGETARANVQLLNEVTAEPCAVNEKGMLVIDGPLPKTRSGKMLRSTIPAICEGRDPGDLTTLDDPAA